MIMASTDDRPRARRLDGRGMRRRRAWIMENWASDIPGFTRCYRCGVLLYNPDDGAVEVGSGLGYPARWVIRKGNYYTASALTIDRIVPGCQGGTYRRDNVRPACGKCNSVTEQVVSPKTKETQ